MPTKGLTVRVYAERTEDGIWNRTSKKTAETESFLSMEENDFLTKTFIKEDLSMNALLRGWIVLEHCLCDSTNWMMVGLSGII